jgi:hypothetical protein
MSDRSLKFPTALARGNTTPLRPIGHTPAQVGKETKSEQARAAAYLRCATSEPGTNPFGAQSAAVAECATANGLAIDKLYVDTNRSGATTMKGRTGLQKMMKDAASGKFDILLVADLDRLSRGRAVFTILEDLRKHDVRVMDVSTDRVIDPAHGLVAEKVRRGASQKARQVASKAGHAL